MRWPTCPARRMATTWFSAAAIVFLLLSTLLAAPRATKMERERITFRPSGISVLAERAESGEMKDRGG